MKKIYGLIGLLGALFILSACNVTAANSKQLPVNEDVAIAVVTDIHYMDAKLTDYKQAFTDYQNSGDGKNLVDSMAILTAFEKDMKNQKPNILIVSGDLTNNGEEINHEQLAKCFARLRKTGIKVYVIPGNHDINNPWARSFKGKKQLVTNYISPAQFKKIYQQDGYAQAVDTDKFSLSYVVKPSKRIWFLMLDDNFYQDNIDRGSPEAAGGLTASTTEWLTSWAKKAKKANVILIPVSHHNFVDHSVISKDFTINYADTILKPLVKYGVKFSLTGHSHAQNIAIKTVSGQTFTDICTGALSVRPHRVGLLTYHAQKRQFTYEAKALEMKLWAKTQKHPKQALATFKKKDYSIIYHAGYDKTLENFAQDDTYDTFSTSQKKELANTMAIHNLSFFAGVPAPASAGEKLWQQVNRGFTKRFVDTTKTSPNDNLNWTSPIYQK